MGKGNCPAIGLVLFALLGGLPLLLCDPNPTSSPGPQRETPSVVNLGHQGRPIEVLQKVSYGALSGADVVLITLDTTRRDHLGIYGFEAARTPVIDALAMESVMFDHAVTGVPSTAPSHASMLTGLEVPRHGVRTNGKYSLSDGHVTLAEILAEEGYATAAFVATYVLNRRFGLHQGFDEYDDRITEARSATYMTDTAVRWLRQQRGEHPDQPVFMWVHYFDPHLPFEPPQEFAAMYPGSLYDAEIAYVDSELGRLLRVLEELGMRNDGVIVLTADHGEGLGEHLEEDHSRLVYDTTMRIPMLITLPPRFAAVDRIDDVTIGTIDLMPTILSLLGVKSPSQVDGLDLRSAAVDPGRLMYLETMAPLAYHGWASLHALRGVDRKFILAPTPEYYDLARDPHELDNLLANESTAAGGLPAELNRRMNAWSPPQDALQGAAPLDAQTARQLAALGYVSTIEDDERTPARLDPKDAYPIYKLLGSGNPEAMIEAARDLLTLPAKDSRAFHRALLLVEEAALFGHQAPHQRLVHGMALYRSGRYEDARRALEGAASSDTPLAQVFTAMALHREGHEADARRLLDGIGHQLGETDEPFLDEALELLGEE